MDLGWGRGINCEIGSQAPTPKYYMGISHLENNLAWFYDKNIMNAFVFMKTSGLLNVIVVNLGRFLMGV